MGNVIGKKMVKVSTKIQKSKRIDALYANIAGYTHTARHNVLRSVNTEQIVTDW